MRRRPAQHRAFELDVHLAKHPVELLGPVRVFQPGLLGDVSASAVREAKASNHAERWADTEIEKRERRVEIGPTTEPRRERGLDLALCQHSPRKDRREV